MSATISDRTLVEVERLLQQREKKEKASVSLSGEIIQAADALSGADGRSAFIERAIRSYMRSLIRRARNRRDLEVINTNAQVTNRESDRVLDFQSWPE